MALSRKGFFLASASVLFLSVIVVQGDSVESSTPHGVKNSFRLPENIRPLHYKLDIITHLDENNEFKFSGRVWIDVSTDKIFDCDTNRDQWN